MTRAPAATALLIVLLAGCGGGSTPHATAHTTGAAALTGAGSTLVAPLVSVWTGPLRSATGIDVRYSGIGSGGGIQSISSRTVDFGASDAPLTPDQASKCNGCVQIPWALSATTLSYDVPGAPNDLRLTGPVIAGIFLGRITSWNDPRIARLNPGVRLPGLKITPVFRSDGSGDTYAFTDYLSRVAPGWRSKVGNATSVQFPAGLGGKGNSGVAGIISRTQGALGYISAAYALPNGLHVAAIQNAAGAFVAPSLAGIAAAAAAVKSVPANDELHIVDPPAASRGAYAISTFTYVIVPRTTSKAATLKRFVDWAVTSGQSPTYTGRLIFAPVPPAVRRAAETAAASLRP